MSPARREARSLVAIGRVDGAVMVRLRRDLDAEGAKALAAVLGDLINNQGNLNVVVDLGAIEALSATAVGVLAAAADWASRRGGSFRVVEASQDVRRTLDAAGIQEAAGARRGGAGQEG